MELKNYSVKEGMSYAIEMVKTLYLGSFLKSPRTGCIIISSLANSVENTGATFYLTDDGVKYLQDVLNKISSSLINVQIVDEPQSQETSPLCYGEDYVSKFKVLGKVIKLPYLFQTVMGKTVRWQKMHLSDKKERYYNKFTPEELQQINDAIRTIAINLASIKLVKE